MNRSFVVYISKFFATFLVVYGSCKALMGLATPGGYYWTWIAEYGNMLNWYRTGLFKAAQILLQVVGYQSVIENTYSLRIVHANAVTMVWSCLGVGLISFWAAFIVASKGSWRLKTAYFLAGFVVIGLCNVVRIALILIANNRNWCNPLHIEHHDMFNYCVYMVLIGMVYGYRQILEKRKTENHPT